MPENNVTRITYEDLGGSEGEIQTGVVSMIHLNHVRHLGPGDTLEVLFPDEITFRAINWRILSSTNAFKDSEDPHEYTHTVDESALLYRITRLS